MGDVVETVTIVTEEGPVRINRSDYDPAVHTLVDNTGASVSVASVSQVATPSASVSVATISEPSASVSAATISEPSVSQAATVNYTVKKKGRGAAAKFHVVDTDGNEVVREGIEADGYATDTEAWAAITNLVMSQQ